MSDRPPRKNVGATAYSPDVERVVAYIRDAIRSGMFAPGQRLIESKLQASLQVSRGTVRESLRRLTAETLLQSERHKGASVRALTVKDIIGIYQIREVLEGLACRLAAENPAFPRAKLKALEADLNKGFDGSARRFLDYNERFHRLIVEASDNRELVAMIANLHVPSFLVLIHTLVDVASIKQARAEHKPIVKAILAGDGAGAERAMRAHVRNTGIFLQRALSSDSRRS